MTGNGDRHQIEVPIGQDGSRLDAFLTVQLPDRSRSQIQKLIKDGHVSGPVKQLRPSTAVRAGQKYTIELPAPVPATAVAEDLPLAIIYEDPDIVILDKPPGMVVHPAAGHESGTLVNALLHHVDDLSGIGGELRPGIVHRLEKEYIALVWGLVQQGRRIDEPIGRDPSDRQKMSTRARRARSAVTRIARAEHLKGVSLLHVAIATGRTHQIRVHLSGIGHPIVGDATYGGVHRRVANDLRAVQRLERPFLHAARLAFAHPTDRRRMEFESPLPADLEAVLGDIRERQKPEPE